VTPTQSLASIAALIDDGTADGRNMLWRRKRWSKRWDEFLEISGVFAALALAIGVLLGSGWIVWEVCYGAWSVVSAIFNRD
jgi:hypothetical protein